MICIFRGHVRAYIKDNEMLFEIIYILWFVDVVSVLNFTEKYSFKSRFKQYKWIKLMQY